MTDWLLFVLVALAAHRAYRLWALDTFPPVRWAREHVESAVDARFGAVWADGVTCSHCAGTWLAFAVVGAVWYFEPLPLPALWFAATACAVGFIAQYDKG